MESGGEEDDNVGLVDPFDDGDESTAAQGVESERAMGRRDEDVRANAIAFAVVVQVLAEMRERVGTKHTMAALFDTPRRWAHDEPPQLLFAYLREYVDSFFPLARLIAPDGDYQRLRYHIADVSFLNLAYRATGAVPPDSSTPVETQLACFMENYHLFGRACTLTVGDVNDLLDGLFTAKRRDDRTHLFLRLIQGCDDAAFRCVARILLKRHHFGAQAKLLITYYNANALPWYFVKRDLRTLLSMFPSRSTLKRDVQIAPGDPFRPNASVIPTSFHEAIGALNTFAIEEKHDGERLMVAIDRVAGKHWAHTRQGVDMTRNMSTTIANVQRALGSEVQSVIVDGEALAWSESMERSVYLEFRSMIKVNRAQLPGMRPRYVVFDIVYLNGKDIRHLPLRERHALLERHITEEPTVVEIVRQDIVPGTASRAEKLHRVLHALDECLSAMTEGLVLKDVELPYVLERQGWLKIKPDQLFMSKDKRIRLQRDLDLLVTGAYFNSEGCVNALLMGARECAADFFDGGKAPVSLRKVPIHAQTAAFRAEADQLVKSAAAAGHGTAMYVPHLAPDRGTTPEPPHVYFPMGLRDCTGRHVVIETLAAEVSTSLVLRFPRLHRVRHDLDFASSTSVEQLRSYSGSLHVDVRRSVEERTMEQLKGCADDWFASLSPRESSGALFKTLRRCGVTDLSSVRAVSNVLRGLRFFVYDGEYAWSQGALTGEADVKTFLAEHGAHVDQALPQALNLAPATGRGRNSDVLTLGFVERCVAAGAWRDPEYGDYAWVRSPVLRQRLGCVEGLVDHPWSPCSSTELDEVLRARSPRPLVGHAGAATITTSEVCREVDELVAEALPLGRVRAYLDHVHDAEERALLRLALRKGGGRAVENVDEATLVVVDKGVGAAADDAAAADAAADDAATGKENKRRASLVRCVTSDEAWEQFTMV